MVECWVPYGKTEVHVSIPMKNLFDFPSIQAETTRNPEKEIAESIQNPLQSPRLAEVAGRGKRVAVSLEADLPSSYIELVARKVIEELLQAQVFPEDVSVIASPGTGGAVRSNLWEQLKPLERLGTRMRCHTWTREDSKELFRTRSGIRVLLDRQFAEADVRIVIGEVKPDLLAGYTGGYSVVFPGLSSSESIGSSLRRLSEARDKAPLLDANPLYQDSKEIGQLLGIDFAVNIVSDPAGKLIKVSSGDPEASHSAAVGLCEEIFSVSLRRGMDIVLLSAGGYPYDRTLGRASPAVCMLSRLGKGCSDIILVAECSEGLGDPTFSSGMKDRGDAKSMEKSLRESWSLGKEIAYRMRKILEGRRLTLVSILPEYFVKSLDFRTGRTANEALASLAKGFAGDTKVTVVPYGCLIIPQAESKVSGG